MVGTIETLSKAFDMICQKFEDVISISSCARSIDRFSSLLRRIWNKLVRRFLPLPFDWLFLPVNVDRSLAKAVQKSKRYAKYRCFSSYVVVPHFLFFSFSSLIDDRSIGASRFGNVTNLHWTCCDHLRKIGINRILFSTNLPNYAWSSCGMFRSIGR